MSKLHNIFNSIIFLLLFSIIFVFSIDNNNIMILNLFPFKIGIEIPVYLYTIIISFISFVLGIIFNILYIKIKSFKKQKDKTK